MKTEIRLKNKIQTSASLFMKHLISVLSVFVLLGTIAPVFGEEITVYTYHRHVPFVDGNKSGLTYDLENFLNQKSSGALTFKIKELPRKRLNHFLKNWVSGGCMSGAESCDNNWMLLWVNQKWGFGKSPEANFHWVKLMEGANVIVSAQKNKVEYQNPSSLLGRKFGGMRGHKYVGIDDLVAEKKITRIDLDSERVNLLNVLRQRVEATLLPKSTLLYILNNDPELSQKAAQFYIAPTTHQTYWRNFMIPKNRDDLQTFISGIDWSNDKNWKTQVAKYLGDSQ